MLEDPELVTLLEEENEEEQPPPVRKLHAQIIINLAVIAGLKIATGYAVRRLVKNIRTIDLLYPEHLNRVNWKDF